MNGTAIRIIFCIAFYDLNASYLLKVLNGNVFDESGNFAVDDDYSLFSMVNCCGISKGLQ